MKKFFAAILALVMAMSLVACGSNGGNAGDNTASDSSVTLTAIVAGLTEDSPSGQALKKFAELTNQYSNGSVTIDCFFNTELGNVAACVEGATQGTIDIVSTGTSYFAGFVPAIQVFELPYIFNSYDEAHKTLDNEPGKAVADMFEGSGLKMLCYWESGMRHVTNSHGPIVEPSDMKGLKIRTVVSPSRPPGKPSARSPWRWIWARYLPRCRTTRLTHRRTPSPPLPLTRCRRCSPTCP